MTRVVIAGATGLIGKQLVVELAGQVGVETHILVRRKPARVPAGVIVHEAAAADWPIEVAAIKPVVAISIPMPQITSPTTAPAASPGRMVCVRPPRPCPQHCGRPSKR